MYDFANIIKSQLKDLDAAIEELSVDVDFDQPKTMFIKKVNGQDYYYCQKEKPKRKQVYLGKEDSERVKAFAINKYKRHQLELIRKNHEVLEDALQNYRTISSNIFGEGIYLEKEDIIVRKEDLLENDNIKELIQWATNHMILIIVI